MPTPGRPHSSTLDHPTRQQLDELDALMQRMLALPVNQLEEGLETSTEKQRNETASVDAVAPPGSRSGDDRAPLAEGLSERVGEWESETRPAGAQERSDSPTLSLSDSPTLPLSHAPEGDRQEPIVARWLRPLLRFNLAFDRSSGWLGPPGRWLRGPGGRAVLGWSGVLLVAVALAWVAWAAMDWTW